MARKCNFDRDQKLTQAMELFWQRGYAHTAISDLIDALQINRFSLYNTFGDKQQLYYEALDKYLQSVSFPALAELQKPQASLSEIEHFLRQFAELQRQRSCGCFMQNALVEHAGEDERVLERGHQLFDHLTEVLTQALANAVASGAVTGNLAPAALASLILTQMQGMRVLGKAKRYQDLEQALETLLQLIKREA
ncbi:TetR/AcrR family transcriptional regulator [Vibrio ostreae]|uniref:TetR/AcrR family transcriptional regulator n=1 Tax=Vibrio ostreae TaxID=2841925 RepID=A0A975U6Z4_9VIBR|nr:TetR/AcrR family transcriptional regulator [Vibrio ostreae]QXO16312.1 TetR/AcrR family transcriptional regulator [Vibrio ostreae]